VRPVLVVERLELAERVEQMGQVPDQGTVEEFVSAGPHPAFHDRIHAGDAHTGGDDLDTPALEDCIERPVYLLSRSLIRYVTVAPASWRSMTRFRAAWVDPVRGGVGGNTENADAAAGVLDDGEGIRVAPFRVVTVRSHRPGSRGPSRARTRPRSDGRVRAPSRSRAAYRISQTVEGATLMPSAASSPWMRRYPQELFSSACQAKDESLDAARGRRSARPLLATRRLGVATAYQVTVPPQDRLRGDDQVQLPQLGPREPMEERGQERNGPPA